MIKLESGIGIDRISLETLNITGGDNNKPLVGFDLSDAFERISTITQRKVFHFSILSIISLTLL